MKIIYLLIICTLLSISQDKLKTAKQLFIDGKHQQSIEILKKIVANDPSSFEPYYVLGSNYMNIGMFQSAIDNFSLSVNQNERHVDSYNSRGLCYSAVGDSWSAITDFDRVLALDPSFDKAFVSRGKEYFNLQDFRQAEMDFNDAIRMNPNNHLAYYERAMVKKMREEYDAAASDIIKAVNISEPNPIFFEKAYFELGNMMYLSRDYNKAIRSYTAALSLNPKNHMVLNNRALSYDSLGQKSKAEADRKTLKDLSGIEFTPFEKLKFTKYDIAGGDVKFTLPENWFKYEDMNTDDEIIEVFTSIPRQNNVLNGAHIKVIINKNMNIRYGVSGDQNILNFWKASLQKNSDDYHEYFIRKQKVYTQFGFGAISFETLRTETPDSPIINTLEFGIAGQDELITIYFEAHPNQFEYFLPIFEKAVDSLEF